MVIVRTTRSIYLQYRPKMVTVDGVCAKNSYIYLQNGYRQSVKKGILLKKGYL